MALSDLIPSELIPSLSPTEIFGGLWETMPPELLAQVTLLIRVGIGLACVLLVYFIIKIIYMLFRFRDSKNIAIIARTIEELNAKIATHEKKTKKEG
jgi:hypothetical protein